MTSIIICSSDDAKYEQAAQMYSRFWLADQFQIFQVRNVRSLAQGYNRGLAAAEGDTLIFSHDDVEILTPDLGERIAHHLRTFDIVGVAGTSRLVQPRWLQAGPPYIHGQVAHPIPTGGYMIDIYSASRRVFSGIQALDGVFLACRRDVARAVQFDEQTFDGFHLYDIDFTFRAYHAGYRLAVACDIQLIHQSVGNFDHTWEMHARRFMEKHICRLAPLSSPREFQWAGCKVDDKQTIREVMTPINWDDPP